MHECEVSAQRTARSALVPLLYRYPPFALAPERLYLFMHLLVETKDVPDRLSRSAATSAATPSSPSGC